MNNERNYFTEFIWLWMKAILIYSISGYFFGMMFEEGFNRAIGFFLATSVFGMAFFNKVIRFNLFGNADSVQLFWILKFIISFIIGVFAFPVVNLYYIINMIIWGAKRIKARKDHA